MSNKGITFAGADILRPGVYTNVDASAMIPSRSTTGGIVGYIGPADSGATDKIHEFSSYDEAKAILKGGPVLSYLSRIFRPSPEVPGASLVRFVRAGSASRASYTLSAAMTLTSLDASRSANGLLYSIDAGTADATLKVRSSSSVDTAFSVRTATIERPAEGYKRTQTLRHGLTITCSVTPTGENKNTIVRDQDGATGTFYLFENGASVASLAFDPTVTIKDVAAWINARSAWKATVVGDYDMPAACLQVPLGTGTLADATYEQNGSPCTETAFLVPAAGVGALAYLFNRFDAQIEASITAYVTALPAGAVTQAAFTGGTGSGLDTMDSDDVNAALALLATVDVRYVFLQSHDSTLQDLVYQHILDMQRVRTKRYRIFYAGFNAYPATKSGDDYIPTIPTNASGVPVLSTESWVDKYVERIRTLDGPVSLCANGTVATNPVTGVAEQLYGLGIAAQNCGMAAGISIAEPMTNKSVLAQGLQYPVISDSDIDKILEAGGTIAYYDQTRRRTVILQALTTYQGGANVIYRKQHGLRIHHQINIDFQEVLADYVGYPLDMTTGILIKQECAKKLDSRIRSGSNPDGYLTPGLVDGQPQPAWTNLKVTGDGIDAWTITVEAHPVGESDYITVNVKLTPVAIQL